MHALTLLTRVGGGEVGGEWAWEGGGTPGLPQRATSPKLHALCCKKRSAGKLVILGEQREEAFGEVVPTSVLEA